MVTDVEIPNWFPGYHGVRAIDQDDLLRLREIQRLEHVGIAIMVAYRHCKNCKWWGMDHERQQLKWRACCIVPSLFAAEGLVTDEEFGCVEFERKDIIIPIAESE